MFTFLGLQHICGNNRLGRFEVLRITDGKRRRKKLQELKQDLRRRMHAPIAEVGEWLLDCVATWNATAKFPSTNF